MKNIILYITLLLVGTEAVAQKKNAAIEKYVKQYSALAVKHQKQYGIPASITLAQGILESGSGASRLTKASNNHFGIKCHSTWRGESVRFNDDKKNECFRKYKTAEDSYEDHSVFLVNGARYAGLFRLKPTDYVKWAKGLQEAGYATNKAYANSLIKIIEDYELYLFDRKSATAKPRKDDPKPDGKAAQAEAMLIKRPVHKSSAGLRYVYVAAGDDVARIAAETGVKVKALLKFNEIPEEFPLQEGAIIYLVKKKKKAEKPNFDHVVQIGESMHSISQTYGIQVKSLYRLNRKKDEYIPEEGDVLKVR